MSRSKIWPSARWSIFADLMKVFTQIMLFFISSVLVTSCFEDPDCINLKNNFVGFTFKKLFDRTLDTVDVIGISVANTDSVFYEFISQDGPFQIPIATNASQQTFDFNLSRGAFSLSLNYQAQAQFESVDCGPRFILSGLTIPNSDFDSVRVINTVPLSEMKGSNIDIYRCPFTNNFKMAFRQLLADENENGIELVESLNGISLDYLPLNFNSNTNVGSVILPLNISTGATNISIDSKLNGLASLNLNYAIQTNSLFKVCGDQPFINDIQIAGSAGYDIVRVVKDSIYDPPKTNVLLLQCPKTNLIQLLLSGAPEEGLQINKVTAGYTSEVFFEDSLATQLVLPLDMSQNQTDFVIEFESVSKQISFGYKRTSQTFHGQCNQVLISELRILSTDFTTQPVLKNDSIQFPTVDNFEIIND